MAGLTVVTGWNDKGFAVYGPRFLQSFHKHWPKSVRLVSYADTMVQMPRGEVRPVSSVPGVDAFYQRHKNSSRAQGKVPVNGFRHKEVVNGYSYRYDPLRWYRQAMIPRAIAPELKDGDILVWLDADVVTFNKIPPDFVENLLGKEPVCYLGRDHKYSEIGFIAFRIPDALPIINLYAQVFDDDTIFELKQWHSGFAFDHAREATGLLGRNLTPGGQGHVWFQSPLGKVMDHTKGDRKLKGRSAERR